MDKKDIQEEAKYYFLPFILGNNPTAHKLSRKIYRKHKIVCYVLDKKRTFADILDFSSRFLGISTSNDDSLTVSQLIYLAEQCPTTLPILIPCSDEYAELIDKNREVLEAVFVLSSKEEALTHSPLSIIPR